MRHVIYPDFYEGIGDEVKFLMYPGHDWFISNQLLFLNATNFTEIPFSAYITYELHSSGC